MKILLNSSENVVLARLVTVSKVSNLKRIRHIFLSNLKENGHPAVLLDLIQCCVSELSFLRFSLLKQGGRIQYDTPASGVVGLMPPAPVSSSTDDTHEN